MPDSPMLRRSASEPLCLGWDVPVIIGHVLEYQPSAIHLLFKALKTTGRYTL
jgi:hypothetical protein